MLTRFLFLILLLKAGFSSSQIIEDRKIGNFKHLFVSNGASVEFTQSNTNLIHIIADESEMQNIVTEVKDEILYIKIQTKCLHKVKILVSGGKNLSSIVCNSSFFESKNKIIASEFQLNVTTASRVSIQLKATNIQATVNSASNVNINGEAVTFTAEVKSASYLNAGSLDAKTIRVKSTGSASKVYVMDKIPS